MQIRNTRVGQGLIIQGELMHEPTANLARYKAKLSYLPAPVTQQKKTPTVIVFSNTAICIPMPLLRQRTDFTYGHRKNNCRKNSTDKGKDANTYESNRGETSVTWHHQLRLDRLRPKRTRSLPSGASARGTPREGTLPGEPPQLREPCCERLSSCRPGAREHTNIVWP